ncbi:hypothetical protein [uncultured Thiodictyon sp.]|uniref:hypothetical protein n=1 Tax=uncultured Thiodictyon sp. TaxID=1846217 RepID=UPI0025D85BED|nr:hypothetical protein [uncultured Thiodictyon sp.]
MFSQRYFPHTEAELIAWLKNYIVALVKYAAFIGIGAEELAATQADIAYLLWVLEAWYPAVRQDGEDSPGYKKLMTIGEGLDPTPPPTPRIYPAPPPAVAPGILNRITRQIQRLKLHTGYTEGMGRDLGILPIAEPVEHPVPEFTLSTEPGAKNTRVCIETTKYGHDAVFVECRINAGPWSPLGHFSKKTIHDERELTTPGLPESREYRLRWWHKDEPVGDWSPAQTILVGA